MGQLSGNALEVRVLWGNQQFWPAGTEHYDPCHADTLWLMLEGQAQVWSGEECWNLVAGDALLWPKNQERRVVTADGASWLSLGVNVITPGGADLLKQLPLPAARAMEGENYASLYSWLRGIVEIRAALANEDTDETSPGESAPRVDTLAALPFYDRWVSQITAERPSYFDVIEEGLAQAIIGLCWGIWGQTDLEQALHRQLPAWLQTTLLIMRKQPEISVQDLAVSAGFSPAQFRRLFNQEMGQSPRDYLQRQRLEYARHLLQDTTLSISAVATQSGFASAAHFVSLWKRTNGLSPLKYRLSRKEKQR